AICPILFDYDNDGDLDVFMHTLEISVGGPAALYRNNGSFSFTDVTAADATSFTTDVADGRGASVADIDNDGDLDIYRTNGSTSFGGGSSYLYLNGTNNSNWLKVKVVGTVSDPQAFGARVKVFNTGTSTLVGYSQVQGQTGYEGFNSLIQHFGVLSSGNYDVQVTFPSGTVETQTNVATAQTITITESGSAVQDWYILE
ncbi:MAG: CRTAC1 family protein, partial [bacterium]